MSNNLRLMLTAAGLGLAGMILAPRLSADEWDQQTTVTVKEPVEVPGQVLSPGTYTFRLLDSLSDRDIVQVFNKDQTKLYTTVIGIPTYRSVPAGHTVITLEERPAGTPEAIKDWFYPGSNYGIEFVYPKAPMAIAQVMPPKPMAPAVVKTAAAPAKNLPVQEATAPAKKQVQIAEATMPSAPAPVPAPAPAPPVKAPARKKLPKTASDYPLLGMLGLLSLAGAGTLRMFARLRG
jgi:hypothetical protein